MPRGGLRSSTRALEIVLGLPENEAYVEIVGCKAVGHLPCLPPLRVEQRPTGRKSSNLRLNRVFGGCDQPPAQVMNILIFWER